MVSKVLAGLVSCVVVLSSCSWATETSIAGRHHCNVDNSESPYSEEETVVTEDSEEFSTEDAEGLGVEYYYDAVPVKTRMDNGKGRRVRAKTEDTFSGNNSTYLETEKNSLKRFRGEESVKMSIAGYCPDVDKKIREDTTNLQLREVVTNWIEEVSRSIYATEAETSDQSAITELSAKFVKLSSDFDGIGKLTNTEYCNLVAELELLVAINEDLVRSARMELYGCEKERIESYCVYHRTVGEHLQELFKKVQEIKNTM